MSKTITGIVTWLKNWFYDKTEIDSELSKKKSHYYGTCSTSASTQIKEVISTDFVLSTGVVLSVKFTNNNTYNGTAKLKINDSEDEINVATVGTTTTSRYYWKAGEVVTFVYDGTNFIMAEGGNATTTYYGITKLSSSTSSTSEALSATPKAVKTAYDLANGKQDALVSGTNIKTINNNSLLGSGNIDISGGGSSVDIVTSWESTLSDSKVPSEKLVKDSLDSKSDSNHNHNIIDLNQWTTYGTTVLAEGIDLDGEGVGLFDNNLIYSNQQNKIYYFNDGSNPNQELAVKGDIPNLTNYVQKSQTNGLIKNDGTIMQSGTGASNFALGNHTHSGYANLSHTHYKSEITDFPTIPTASTTPAMADHYRNSGVTGTSTDYARADHQHTHVNFICAGTTGSAGYIKLFQLKINTTYQDHPIGFDIEQRGTNKDAHISIRFTNASNTDPELDSITHYGYNGNYYLYKESTSTWSFIIQKKDNYDSVQISNLVSGMGGITITKVDEQISSLPTGYVQSTYTVGGASFGTTAGTVCQGNDSRLSDARNPKMTNITSGDLNDYITAGFYYCGSNTQAENILHRPKNVKAFYLQVERWGSSNNVKQTISSYHQDAPHPLMYIRTMNGAGTWSDWRQISTYNEPKFIDNETTLTSTVNGTETLRLADGYFFQNKNNDWAIMGEIKVTGPASRFEVQVPTNTNTYNLIAIGKNTSGNYSTWWSTSASAETVHQDANVTFNNDTWYPFSIMKRGNTITFNFNNTKHHEHLPSYMNGHTYLTPQLRKWTTSNVSVRNLKIIPHIIDPVQDVTTNIDFNDYKKEGKYLIWASHQTSNTNAPDTQGGLLEVEIIPNGVKQTLTQYYVANPKIYYRIFHATAGWREWEEVIVTSDVVNNLTSTSTTAPLSANQGKVLKDGLTWKTVSLTNMSGISLQYNDLFCRVIVNGDYSINTANAYKNLVTGTIPADYRPNHDITGLNNGTVLIRVKVTHDGYVQYYSPQTFSSSAGVHTELIWGR